MSCYTPESWVDFVRHTMLPEQIAQIEQHLNGGCAKCSDAFHLWHSFADFAKRQVLYNPPAEVVQTAKVSFNQPVPQKARHGFTLVASLVFDSLRQPRPAGVRQRKSIPQQLMYAAGDYLVDLRVEGSSKRMVLVGQVLDSANPGQALPGIQVALLVGNEPFAKTTSSPFGEFQFEFGIEIGKEYQLAIGLDSQSSIVVPLRDVKPPKRVSAAWPQSSRPASLNGRNPFRQN